MASPLRRAGSICLATSAIIPTNQSLVNEANSSRILPASSAAAFVLEWKDSQTVKEKAEAQTFETEFLKIFGVDRKKVALFPPPVNPDCRLDRFVV